MKSQTPAASRDHHPVDTNRSFADFLGLAVKGFCMGIADVIPGISGGTIAFMLEIYEDLIQAIKSFDARFLRLLLTGKVRDAFGSVAWRFLGAVLFGIGCAILLFSRVVSRLLTHHPFVRVLEWLFAKFHDYTIAVLTGFVIGSLNKIWPWKQTLETLVTDHGKVIPIREANGLPHALDGHFAVAIALFAAGCAVAFILHAIPQKHLKS